jgi:hypothetical protein
MSPPRLLTLVLLIVVGGLLFFAAFMYAGAVPGQDFAAFWSAAHLIRQDPYSYELHSQFKSLHGLTQVREMVVRNPPWALLFILPIAAFGYQASFAFWGVVSLVIIVVCARVMWQHFRLPPTLTSIVLPLLFGPTVVLLMLGQWTVLSLLGFVGFLIATERRWDWVAGAALILVLGKPQIALLFLFVVPIWSVFMNRWAVLYSGAVALLGSSLIVGLLNAHIFTLFFHRIVEAAGESEIHPNLGGFLYLISGVHLLATFPQLGGLVWSFFYWKKHKEQWDWWRHGSLLLACSLCCSFYSNPYDEILALPALLVAYADGDRRIFFSGFLLTNLAYALYFTNVAGYFGFDYMFLWWTSLGWLATFLLARTSFVAVPTGNTRNSVR